MTNALDTKYCSECGVELDKATFGLSIETIEKWSDKFARDGWKREITSADQNLLQSVRPPFDGRSETVIFREKVVYDGWTIALTGSEFAIEPEHEGDKGGAIIATNWRIIVLDYSYDECYTFLYEHLSSASVSNQNAGEYPVFMINFGEDELIEWYRSQMTKPHKGRGFLGRILNSTIQNQTLDVGELMLARQSGQNLAADQSQNALLVDFFGHIIAERQKL